VESHGEHPANGRSRTYLGQPSLSFLFFPLYNAPSIIAFALGCYLGVNL